MKKNKQASEAAATLGRLTKGVKKKLTPAERAARAERMRAVGKANAERKK